MNEWELKEIKSCGTVNFMCDVMEMNLSENRILRALELVRNIETNQECSDFERVHFLDFLKHLPGDQQKELAAIALVGRGEFDDLDPALKHCESYSQAMIVHYLMNQPGMAESITNGLIRLRKVSLFFNSHPQRRQSCVS